MTVTGPFDDAASTVTRVQVTFAMQALPAFKSLFMYFNAADWADRIGVLAVGNPITVRGVIERVSRIDIMLDDCELVS